MSNVIIFDLLEASFRPPPSQVVTFFSLLVLGRHLVEAAFLKDIPCEMLVFSGQGVHETLRKAVPKEVEKRTLKNQ